MDTNTVAIVTEFGNKLDNYISVLTSKAGVAAEHFWPVLVQQQVVEGWSGIIATLLNVIMFGLALKLFFRSLPNDKYDNLLSPKAIGGVFVGAIIGILFLIPICINVSNLQKNVSKITNPEYYAIQSLVTMVK